MLLGTVSFSCDVTGGYRGVASFTTQPCSWFGPKPTQPTTRCGTGNEYRPKCGDALRLGLKAGWLIPLVDKHVGGE